MCHLFQLLWIIIQNIAVLLTFYRECSYLPKSFVLFKKVHSIYLSFACTKLHPRGKLVTPRTANAILHTLKYKV